MAFRVKKAKRFKGPQFKVQFEWFENKVRKTRDVPKDEWPRHGFREDMDFEQAAKRKDQLNAEERLHQTEKKRAKIKQRLDKERDTQAAFLPPQDVAEFEADIGISDKPKKASYWNAAKRIICALNLPLRDWEAKAPRFYAEFIKHKMSPAYVEKVLPLINHWGKFQARKYGTPFFPIPSPKGDHKNSLYESHFDKTKSRGNKKSEPLTPEMLEEAEAGLKPEQYRWLFMSVWFGLRPIEVDSLNKPTSKKTWYVTQEKGTQILWIYQTKLKGVDPKKRTKGIPCISKEQKQGLKFLGSEFKRPLQKTMADRFGADITLYGGRKGFTKLMKGLGQTFENVSAWLGHTDINRTYKDYFDRQEVSWSKVA